MPSPKPLSRENRIYLALWRRATRTEEPLVLPVETKHQALALKMALYRALAPWRDGREFDPELSIAAEQYSATANLEGEIYVTMGRKATFVIANRLKDALGISEDELKDDAEKSLDKLLEREVIVERLEQIEVKDPGTPPEVPNPFFSRRD